MPSYPFFLVLFVVTLLTAQICALPTAFQRRAFGGTKVCGQPMRLDSRSARVLCLRHGQGFLLTPSSSSTVSPPVSITSDPGKNVHCDHIVEIQLLQNLMDTSGVCALINSMIEAQPSLNNKTFLDLLSGVINDPENLFFLDRGVNGQKAVVIARSIGTNPKAQTHTPLDKAVGNYLADPSVKTASNNIAASLDSKVSEIILKADSIVSTLANGAAKTNLQAAITKVRNSPSPILSTAWNKVLSDAAKL